MLPEQQKDSEDNTFYKFLNLLALTIDSLEGKQGPRGFIGPKGEQGERGEQGVAGADGKDGAVGPQGPAGKDGKDGKDGRDGKDGKIGPQGPKGDIGPQGPAGKDGKDGESVSPENVINLTTPIIVQNVQKAVSSKTITANDVQGLAEFVAENGGAPGGAAAWGDITGTLSAQTDLQTALDGKANSLGVDDNYVTDAEKTKLANLSGVNTGDQDLSGYSLTSHTHTVSDITDFPTLATVATSGDYDDLINKPSASGLTALQTASLISIRF